MKNSIFVFKTSVEKNQEIKRLSPFLDNLIRPGGRWNFDLEDCDNILKVVNPNRPPNTVIHTLGEKGFYCEEL